MEAQQHSTDVRPRIKSLLALSIVVFIPFALMVWLRLHQSSVFAVAELIMYPLLFGGVSIAVILALKTYFLREKLQEFNTRKGTWLSDVAWGLILVLIYFMLFFIERPLLSGLLHSTPNIELLNLMLEMRANPFLLVLWFGPVLWIGIALYEELIRVFLLTSLWKFSRTLSWAIAVILFTSFLIGLVHLQQGSYGAVTIGIKSIVSCTYFFKKRRLMPLVYAHVLYDGLQVGALLLTYPES